MRTKDLFAFIKKRHDVYLAKAAGKPAPWTADTILQQYRFCNVYRELDTVTQWIGENWRKPHENDPNLWFAMVIARLLNNPETLAEIGYPTKMWNPGKFHSALAQREARGGRVFNPAYIVSTNGISMRKITYVTLKILEPLWEDRSHMKPHPKVEFSLWHEALMGYNGLGSFLAAQVIADVKYAKPYLDAPDWWTFAASGPGSRRGLNRVCERPIKASWPNMSWENTLIELQAGIDPLAKKANMPRIHAQDLQNCLCEFDKYERVRLGEGRPKQKYNGG